MFNLRVVFTVHYLCVYTYIVFIYDHIPRYMHMFLPCQILVEVYAQVFYFGLKPYFYIVDDNLRTIYTFRVECNLR
jgi:hypothetical protein